MTDRLAWTRTDFGFRADIAPGRSAVLRFSEDGIGAKWEWSVRWDEASASGSAVDRQAAADAANAAVPEVEEQARQITDAKALDQQMRERVDELSAGHPLTPEDLEFEGLPYDQIYRLMQLATAKYAPSGKRAAVELPVLEVFMAALSAEFYRRRKS